MHRIGKYLAATALCLVMSGCTTTDPGALAQNDPLEPTNRVIFEANMTMDRNVARPVAKFYVSAVPAFIRTGIHNVLDNFGKPVVLGNDILQGEPKLAGQTLARFFANSTLGLGGLFDVATLGGVPDHTADFGQTLGVWGVGEGPYLMMPFFGPSSPRDVVGKAGDFFMDPMLYAHYNYENLANDSKLGFGIIDARGRTIEATDQLQNTSLDYYATMRSLYRQYRKAQIAHSDPNVPPTDDNDPADEQY